MKKIIGFLLIAFSFMFLFSFVSAEETTAEEYALVVDDLENYSQTNFSIKMRFTHLLNSINFKISQVSEIILDLEENDVNTSELYDKLTYLEVLREDVLEVLESEEDDFVLKYVSLKQDSLNLISEIRVLLKDIVPEENYQNLKIMTEGQRQELSNENRERIRTLVTSHNQEIKSQMSNKFNDFKKEFCNENDCVNDLNKLKSNFENHVKNIKEEKKLQNKNMVMEKVQMIRNLNEERKVRMLNIKSQNQNNGNLDSNQSGNQNDDFSEDDFIEPPLEPAPNNSGQGQGQGGNNK